MWIKEPGTTAVEAFGQLRWGPADNRLAPCRWVMTLLSPKWLLILDYLTKECSALF
jgi:hypothetical protein